MMFNTVFNAALNKKLINMVHKGYKVVDRAQIEKLRIRAVSQ